MQKLSLRTCWSGLILVGLVSAFVFFMNHDRIRSGKSPPPPAPVRHIQYSFTIQNTKNTVLSRADLWLHAPAQETSMQRCRSLEISHPHELIRDELGNQVLHLSFSDFSPYASKIVTVKAELESQERPRAMPFAGTKIFLQPEKDIESDHPEIITLANTLKGISPAETVKNTFTWVAHNLRSIGYLKNSRGALYALRNKEGDCTEFMSLFVALCRANRIPARGIGGYVCAGDCIVTPTAYHNWAEFYLDGAWRIADPQKKVFMENESQYVAMRVLGSSAGNTLGDFNRFRVDGDGLKAKMNTDS